MRLKREPLNSDIQLCAVRKPSGDNIRHDAGIGDPNDQAEPEIAKPSGLDPKWLTTIIQAKLLDLPKL